jgi:hypothetical protein
MAENAISEVKPQKLGGYKWGTDVIEQIRKMADDGLSAAQTSAKMEGLSRCAILGVAHRKGIKFKGFVPGTDRKYPVNRKAKGSKKPSKPKIAPQPKPAPKFHCFSPQEPRGMVTLMKLQDDSCRYPYDTREGLRYCGEQTYTDQTRDKKYSWCPIHCRTVFQ